MNDKVILDTQRLNNIVVECTANIVVDGEDVRLSVMSFGEGEVGTENAFGKMEKILPSIMGVKFQEVEIVRVY